MPLPQQQYKFLSAFNTGGMENGCTCDNCGRLIVNVVTITDANDNQYNVGEDCAVTLQGIKEDFDFNYNTLPIFQALKSFNAKVRKLEKSGTVYESWHEYAPKTGFYKQGGFIVNFQNPPTKGGSYWVNYPIEYLPIFQETIKNLSKNG